MYKYFIIMCIILTSCINPNCKVVNLPSKNIANTKYVDIKVLSFNIVYEAGFENILNLFRKEKISNWNERIYSINQLFIKENPDIVSLQESNLWQTKCLMQAYPDYVFIFFESLTDTLIMYKKDLFDEKSRDWLKLPNVNEKKEMTSNFIPRTLLWSELKYKNTTERLLFMATHLDNRKTNLMIDIVYNKTLTLNKTYNNIILAGDFNTGPGFGNYKQLISNGFKDSYLSSKLASASGFDNNVNTLLSKKIRIDHIFYKGNNLSVLDWQRYENKSDKVVISDHYPVISSLRLYFNK